MGLAARIIPCLDVCGGRVVKGVKFANIRDAGDPVEAARRYDAEGADELCFLDITASHEGRGATLEVVSQVAEQVWIPLTVGGGVTDEASFEALLRAGADKVSINSAAVHKPELIPRLARRYGSQCVVVAIDARLTRRGKWPQWTTLTHGGRRDTGLGAVAWAERAARYGAGELLLTSIDADGTLGGYDLPLLRAVCGKVTAPVIASGGAGRPEHFAQAILAGASAALAASVFHDRTFSVGAARAALAAAGIETTGAHAAREEAQ